VLARSHYRAFRLLVAGQVPAAGTQETGSQVTAKPAPQVDLGGRELLAITPLVVVCLVLGFYPAPLFALVRGGVSDVNQLVNPPGPDEIAMLGQLEETVNP
jgi:NADH:ubiquinone oxidoreductase subunit 4 (subunit M)